MTQCKICLDDIVHPMGQYINHLGICSGCLTHSEKNNIDWNLKWTELQQLCFKSSKKKKGTYDCIIPINGDAEDYFIVETALSLNLEPLLVFINNYYGTDLSWHNIHNLETHFDLDLVTFNPNILTYKEAVRTSLRKFNSIYWPYQAIKTSYPVKLALEMKIPLILWGGLQATEQTGKFSHNDMVEMSGWGRLQHDLFCTDEATFFGTGAQINERQQNTYKYPPINKLKNVRGIYLSNYMRWDPWLQNKKMIKYGFKPEKSIYTFDQYERAGSSVFYLMHDILRFEKFGYRKVRDHLSREIRHKRINRIDAKKIYIDLLSRSVDVDSFFDWLGVTESGKKSFIEKKMSKSKFLLGKKTYKDIKIKSFSQDFFDIGHKPKSFYLNYFKGI